jgi:hypothetical protein
MMGILDWFRRPPPIADRAALVDFLDTRAAFLSQKSIFDYARGRSGPYFPQMLKEQAFNDGVNEARWKNYPVAVSIVAEMVYGVLLPVMDKPAELAAALDEAALEAFDRYPVPPMLGSEYWAEARTALAARVNATALHPAKFVKDIPLPFADTFFKNMPIHERLREQDFELIRNQLRVNLLSMHRDFTARADLPALVADLMRATHRPAA